MQQISTHTDESAPLHWYAYKVFHNKARILRDQLELKGLQCYIPIRKVIKSANTENTYSNTPAVEIQPVIPSLLFIRSTEATMAQLRQHPYNLWVYCLPGTNIPATIPDREMEVFIFVTTKGCQSLESIDQKIVKGDRVKITGGILQGAEGYITRVHGTKRFVVVINGVAAIATGYIPKQFIEKIEDTDLPNKDSKTNHTS